MSKKGLNITISVILLFVFLISASAHSGRTDANGGHWNRSTGEYHYHTGEYAGRSQSSSKSNGTRASQELIDIIDKHEAQKKNQESQKRIPPPKYQPSKKDKTSFWDVVIEILKGLLALIAYYLLFLCVPYWIYILIKKLFSRK